jgi:dTDP-4-amino-4,6-dideoxygalactose transaminase
MGPILELATENNLIIIEDAACALGSEYKNRKCGGLGDIGCFSFHPRKAITTGEGGIVVTDDEQIAKTLRTWRNHGIVDNNGKYDFVLPGFNYRMTDFQGAIGIVQMRKLDGIISKKLKLAKIYDELLKNINYIKIPETFKEVSNVYQSYVIILDRKIDRDSFILELKARGVETSIGTYALHMLSYYKNKYGYEPNDFPNAKRAYENSISLPLHPGMDEEDVEFVVENIRDIVNV